MDVLSPHHPSLPVPSAPQHRQRHRSSISNAEYQQQQQYVDTDTCMVPASSHVTTSTRGRSDSLPLQLPVNSISSFKPELVSDYFFNDPPSPLPLTEEEEQLLIIQQQGYARQHLCNNPNDAPIMLSPVATGGATVARRISVDTNSHHSNNQSTIPTVLLECGGGGGIGACGQCAGDTHPQSVPTEDAFNKSNNASSYASNNNKSNDVSPSGVMSWQSTAAAHPSSTLASAPAPAASTSGSHSTSASPALGNTTAHSSGLAATSGSFNGAACPSPTSCTSASACQSPACVHVGAALPSPYSQVPTRQQTPVQSPLTPLSTHLSCSASASTTNNNSNMGSQSTPGSTLSHARVLSLTSKSSYDPSAEYVGPFKLGPVLGRGCTGTVRLGTHKHTGFEVAFKIIEKKYLNSDDKLWKKVKREIVILKLVEHPHVLKLYDVLETENKLYLVLEHVKGGELFDYIVSKGRLDRHESLRLIAQICMGLEHCHSHHICHRDLKPENLLLDDKLNIKIADFGMAQLMKADSRLKTSCGSPHYASPEIIEGGAYDAKRTDVWSIGVILYALITGSLPFDHDNIPTLLQMVCKGQYSTPSFVPSDVSHLISRMLTVDPNKRITLEAIKDHPCFRVHPQKFNYFYLPPSYQQAYTAYFNTTHMNKIHRRGSTGMVHLNVNVNPESRQQQLSDDKSAIVEEEDEDDMSDGERDRVSPRKTSRLRAVFSRSNKNKANGSNKKRKSAGSTRTKRQHAGSLDVGAMGDVDEGNNSGNTSYTSDDDGDAEYCSSMLSGRTKEDVTEQVLKDLESLGWGSTDELRKRVFSKTRSNKQSMEREFFKLLKRRRNERLKQLSILSPKVSFIRAESAPESRFPFSPHLHHHHHHTPSSIAQAGSLTPLEGGSNSIASHHLTSPSDNTPQVQVRLPVPVPAITTNMVPSTGTSSSPSTTAGYEYDSNTPSSIYGVGSPAIMPSLVLTPQYGPSAASTSSASTSASASSAPYAYAFVNTSSNSTVINARPIPTDAQQPQSGSFVQSSPPSSTSSTTRMPSFELGAAQPQQQQAPVAVYGNKSGSSGGGSSKRTVFNTVKPVAIDTNVSNDMGVQVYQFSQFGNQSPDSQLTTPDSDMSSNQSQSMQWSVAVPSSNPANTSTSTSSSASYNTGSGSQQHHRTHSSPLAQPSSRRTFEQFRSMDEVQRSDDEDIEGEGHANRSAAITATGIHDEEEVDMDGDGDAEREDEEHTIDVMDDSGVDGQSESGSREFHRNHSAPSQIRAQRAANNQAIQSSHAQQRHRQQQHHHRNKQPSIRIKVPTEHDSHPIHGTSASASASPSPRFNVMESPRFHRLHYILATPKVDPQNPSSHHQPRSNSISITDKSRPRRQSSLPVDATDSTSATGSSNEKSSQPQLRTQVASPSQSSSHSQSQSRSGASSRLSVAKGHAIEHSSVVTPSHKQKSWFSSLFGRRDTLATLGSNKAAHPHQRTATVTEGMQHPDDYVNTHASSSHPHHRNGSPTHAQSQSHPQSQSQAASHPQTGILTTVPMSTIASDVKRALRNMSLHYNIIDNYTFEVVLDMGDSMEGKDAIRSSSHAQNKNAPHMPTPTRTSTGSTSSSSSQSAGSSSNSNSVSSHNRRGSLPPMHSNKNSPALRSRGVPITAQKRNIDTNEAVAMNQCNYNFNYSHERPATTSYTDSPDHRDDRDRDRGAGVFSQIVKTVKNIVGTSSPPARYRSQSQATPEFHSRTNDSSSMSMPHPPQQRHKTSMPNTHINNYTSMSLVDDDNNSGEDREGIPPLRGMDDSGEMMMVDGDMVDKVITMDSHNIDAPKGDNASSDENTKLSQLTMDSFAESPSSSSSPDNNDQDNDKDKHGNNSSMNGDDEIMSAGDKNRDTAPSDDAVKFVIQIYQQPPHGDAQKGDIEYRCVEFTHTDGDEKAYRSIQQRLQAILSL